MTTSPSDLAVVLQEEFTRQQQDVEKARKDAELGDPDRRFANWYMRCEEEDEHNLEILKLQYERMRAAIERRRDARRWKFGSEFQGCINMLLKKVTGNRKSVDLEYGRSGYRKLPERVDVYDVDAAVNWAAENLPDAIKLDVSKTKIKAHIKSTGEEPPGCKIVGGGDRFYPDVRPQLLDEETIRRLAEGGGDNGTE